MSHEQCHSRRAVCRKSGAGIKAEPTHSMAAPVKLIARLWGRVAAERKSFLGPNIMAVTSRDVNYGATCKINQAHLAKPASSPHPVSHREVDD